MSAKEEANRDKTKLAGGIIVLACICLSSGAGVGFLYSAMKDEIQAKADEVFRDTLAEVLGEAEQYGVVGAYLEGTKDTDKVYMNEVALGVLYAATGTARGYQGPIQVLVSVRSAAPNSPVGRDPVIQRMAVVSSQETPGLGENIKLVEKDVSIWGALAGRAGRTEGGPKRPWFQEQFSGLRLRHLDGEGAHEAHEADGETSATPPDEEPERGVVAITGATITSKATVAAVRNAVHRIIETTAEAYGQ